jgi:histidinol-phosphate aminotransferase
MNDADRVDLLLFADRNACQAVAHQAVCQGVIVRPVGVYSLPEWLRISAGTEAENARCLAALRTALEV